MLLDKVHELDEVFAMDPLQILPANAVAELAQVGSRIERPHQFDSRGVERHARCK